MTALNRIGILALRRDDKAAVHAYYGESLALFAAAWADGCAMTYDGAVEYALQDSEVDGPPNRQSAESQLQP